METREVLNLSLQSSDRFRQFNITKCTSDTVYILFSDTESSPAAAVSYNFYQHGEHVVQCTECRIIKCTVYSLIEINNLHSPKIIVEHVAKYFNNIIPGKKNLNRVTSLFVFYSCQIWMDWKMVAVSVSMYVLYQEMYGQKKKV